MHHQLYYLFQDDIEKDGKKYLALAPDLEKNGSPLFSDIQVGEFTEKKNEITSSPISFTMPVPDPASGKRALSLYLKDMVFSGSLTDAKKGMNIAGQMKVDDLVGALIDLAGFDKKGAHMTLSGIIKYDPKNPPEFVPFEGEIIVEAK